jgi:tRNA1Val (adenine37-N6)-methyltransferase
LNFPRALSQPVGGHRFSVDALLLACFARLRKADRRGLDLGTGCGVVGLALLLAQDHNDLHITGLDNDPEMLRHASLNAERLGFQHQFKVQNDDVSSYVPETDPPYDFVSSNPPWREPGRGRQRPGPDKAHPRQEGRAGLTDFAAAARRSLKTRGRFFLVHLPERLPEILAVCSGHGLAPKRLRLVHGHARARAKVLLLEAVKAGGPGLLVEPPLVLYAGPGRGAALMPEALAFCPFLACNRADAKE